MQTVKSLILVNIEGHTAGTGNREVGGEQTTFSIILAWEQLQILGGQMEKQK